MGMYAKPVTLGNSPPRPPTDLIDDRPSLRVSLEADLGLCQD